MPSPEAWAASVFLVQCDLQVIIQRDSAQTFPIHSQDFCSWFSTMLHMNVWSNISSSRQGNGKEGEYMFCSVVKLETRKFVLVWVFFPCSEKNMQMKCEREIILKADRSSITERTGPSRESQIQGTTERNHRKLGLTLTWKGKGDSSKGTINDK